MKQVLFSLVALCAMGAMAQEEAVPVGVPARLEAINGKVVKVLLQSAVGSNITFRVYPSVQDITVEQDKIKSLTFYPKYEAEVAEQRFAVGDYAGVLANLEPVLEPYRDYMAIENNLHSALCMQMDAYRESGDFPKVREIAQLLASTDSPQLVLKGQVNTALADLADGDIPAAEKMRGEVDSEAAGLYLQACIERAKQQPKAAINTAIDVIAKYGNDMDWLPPSELLCAQLYLDMAMTNSADSTARQVQSLYAGTHIAKDAEMLRAGLVRTEDEAEAEDDGKAVE